MKEPVHEVAAYAKLRISCLRVAHRREEACLETVEGVPLLLAEVTATKEPLLAFNGSLLAMTVVFEREVAVRDEVRNLNFGGRGVEGSRGDLVVLLLHCVRNSREDGG